MPSSEYLISIKYKNDICMLETNLDKLSKETIILTGLEGRRSL